MSRTFCCGGTRTASAETPGSGNASGEVVVYQTLNPQMAFDKCDKLKLDHGDSKCLHGRQLAWVSVPSQRQLQVCSVWLDFLSSLPDEVVPRTGRLESALSPLSRFLGGPGGNPKNTLAGPKPRTFSLWGHQSENRANLSYSLRIFMSKSP